MPLGMLNVKYNYLILILILSLASSICWAEELNTQEQFKSLDNRIQNLKRSAVELGKEIAILEEELLFPANTQYGLYLSMDTDESYKLITVIVKLDGNVVNNYMYDVSELNALANGAVHQLHKGNLKTGKHTLSITYMGKVGSRMTRLTNTHEFEKGDKPVFIELNLSGKQLGKSGKAKEPTINVKQWS